MKELSTYKGTRETDAQFLGGPYFKMAYKNENDNGLFKEAGAKAILLECITQETAKKITSSISLPTIGIGSSKYCDGQVLVFDDLIKIDKEQYFPKFVKNYLNFDELASNAVKKFSTDVRQKKFPSKKYSYQ